VFTTMAAASLLAGCGGHRILLSGPLKPVAPYTWEFGLPVQTNEEAAFGFAMMADASRTPVTITGARPAGVTGAYRAVASFVLEAPYFVVGPLVQASRYPPPPMSPHAIRLPVTLSSAEGQVEVVIGFRFVKAAGDIRFRGVEVDYTARGRHYKAIYPVAVRLCLTRRPTCPKPPASFASRKP
jgi:hypothetical protein